MQTMCTNFREKIWRFDGGTAPRGTTAVQRAPLWPKAEMVPPALGTKFISCPEMACGQSRCGQNVPPCGHCGPSALPAHPGLTPPAGQNGPAVKHTESFSSPFPPTIPTARRCNCSHIFPPLPTATADARAHPLLFLFLRSGDTRAHADFCLFPPPALAAAHCPFHPFQRHADATASTVV